MLHKSNEYNYLWHEMVGHIVAQYMYTTTVISDRLKNFFF